MMTPYSQQAFQPYSMFQQPNNLQPNLPVNTPNSFNNPVIDTGIIWVQGESGAKAYPVQPGKSMVLFDSETEHFFIKSVDISGMPQPLRMFSYSESTETETKQPEIDTSMFITRDEFQKAIEQIQAKYQRPMNSEVLSHRENKGGRSNGKSLIQSAE